MTINPLQALKVSDPVFLNRRAHWVSTRFGFCHRELKQTEPNLLKELLNETPQLDDLSALFSVNLTKIFRTF